MQKNTKRSNRDYLEMAQVIDIRRARSLNIGTSDIASRYNVNPRTVRRVVSGETHSNVPSPQRIKRFSNYEITPDGRVWSNAAKKYLTASNGRVKLRSTNGTSKTVSITDLLKTYF